MPPLAPVMSTVVGCCQERREDCLGARCLIVLSRLTVSLDVKTYRSLPTFNVSVIDITLHIAEARLQPDQRRDGGGLGAQDSGP
jgi:hypothetical protein